MIVLASGDPGDGSTPALERAVRSAVGERATVVIKIGDDGTHASSDVLVGTVTWTEHERDARLRTNDGARTTEREIHFDTSDQPAERGRTVGFALASMIPDAVFAPPPPPPAAPIAPTPIPRETPIERSIRPPRFSIELVGQGAVGLGGTGGGLGGEVAGRLHLAHGFDARLGFGIRLGEVTAAQATSRILAPSIGLGWQTSLVDWFRLGGRIDALLLNQYVSHFSADDIHPDDRDRFMPGADARFEVALRIVPSTYFVLAVGPEVAFGTTRVVVAGVETDRIPPLRLCADVGVTVAF